ncbi:MAG TPA: phosphoribosyltransferase family protein [Falsiroseomonas sp.]|jgi:predicted phosphoribosyltransferase|nr:phosphoribosyltransferase family protein [Falsiroseomonas sp.]
MALAAPTYFTDRTEAGRLLAARLQALHPMEPIVYALPRGGVPVAAEVAAALGAPLDLVLVRKIGAPGQPELGIGAVVDGGEMVLNPDIVAVTGASEAFIEAARQRELAEIERRRQRYMPGRPPLEPKGRSAVVVDDGLATGATARAALRALRRRGAARLILAVPVAPPEALADMRDEADEAVAVIESGLPFGIGGYYDDFHQLTDGEVIEILSRR